MTVITTTKLAADLSALVNRWNTRENQMISFISQPTGTVTVTDGAGETHVLPSFPQLQIDMMTQTNALSGQLSDKVDKISGAPEDISERIDSGFYRRAGTAASSGWPVDDQWSWHLLSMTAWSNSYSAMQFACAQRNNTLYFRTTNGDGNAPWVKLWHSANFDPDSRLRLTGGTLSGNLKIERDGEAQLRLKSTSENGREIILLSNSATNAGLYDASNGKWLFQIRADDLINLKGFFGGVSVQANATSNAVYWMRDETGTNRSVVFWNRATDSLTLQRYDTSGEQPVAQGRLRILSDGTVTSDYAVTAPLFNGKASSADKLNSSTKINGTSFNGTADIITSRWGAERTLKIGDKSQTVNGTGNVTWSLADIGAVGNENGVAKIRKMTQAAYNALSEKDASTLYIIV